MSEITLMDGAVGTSLWEKSSVKIPVWQYNMTDPAIVSELELEYAGAGSEIVLANTFGINRISVQRTPYDVKSSVQKAMEIINTALDGVVPCFSPTGAPVKRALAIGPLPVLMEPYGDLPEDEASEIFNEVMDAAAPFKPDFIYIQTFIDLAMMENAVRAAERYGIPVLASMSFEPVGKTIFGNSPEDMALALEKYDYVAAIGLNCSLGPEAAVPVMKAFRQATDMPLIFKPNAGKPILAKDGGGAEFDVDTFVKDVMPALEYGVGYVGGCCGSNASYIRRLREAMGRNGEEKK